VNRWEIPMVIKWRFLVYNWLNCKVWRIFLPIDGVIKNRVPGDDDGEKQNGCMMHP
jgi:hypothetical protein